MSLPVELRQALDCVDELPQLRAQAFGRRDDPHPSPPSQPVLEPMLENVGHAHGKYVDPTWAIAIDVTVVTDRPPRHNTQEPGLLLGLANRRVARQFTMVDRALGHDPAPAARCRDERDLDASLANPVRYDRRLPM